MDVVALYAELDAIKVKHESSGLPYYAIVLLCLRHAREAVPFSCGHDVIRELLTDLMECTMYLFMGDVLTEEEALGLSIANDVLYAFIRLGEIRDAVEEGLSKFDL